MIGPEHEAPRPATGAGFAEAVTFAWGDAERELYGTARLGLAGETRSASGLGLLFAGRDVAAVSVVAGAKVEHPDWAHARAGAVTAETLEPLVAWRIALETPEGGFDLRFEALAAPAEFVPEKAAAARAVDLHGYEQLCRVTGGVHAGGRSTEVACLGQRGHEWGAPDWKRIAAARTVSAWLAPDLAVALAAVRPARSKGHEQDAVSAFVVTPRGEDGPPAPVAVDEARLSTGYDGQGRHRRAGLELWFADDETTFPRRAAGEAVCGTSLPLGSLQLDCAFFAWRMEGRTGTGRYDVLRRA